MISLPDLQLLEISGTDAVAFAHAQFSSDVRGLANGAWQWSTWLSPQGRVRALFQLVRDDSEHLRLLLRSGTGEALRAALAPYVLRAKVRLHVGSTRVCGSDQPAAHALLLPGSPPRWLIAVEAPADPDDSPAARERWHLADVRAGLPMLAASLLDQLLPQWLGLDRLGAISVNKGCYPGQEVMSRLHFKGGNKRSLYRIELAGPAVPGTALSAPGNAAAGLIVMTARREDGRTEALACLADAAADAPLLVDAPSADEIAVLGRFT
jgi:folate-binding protein YgfZ